MTIDKSSNSPIENKLLRSVDAEKMHDYIRALTIVISVCIGLAITIPMLCLCICLIRFCYVARRGKKLKKPRYSKETHQVKNTKLKGGTSQQFTTDSTVIILSGSGRQIAKGQLDRSRSGGELKSKDTSMTGSTPEQGSHT